jgi:AmmeMemoRadiSam system protein B
LAKTASQILQQARTGRHLQIQLELAVLTDPVPIGGTLANVRWAGRTPSVADLEASGLDWRGHDPGRRAIVAMQGGERVSVAWDAFSTPDALIDQGLQHLTRRAAPVTIYSMAVVATRPQGIATSAAAAQTGPGIRPPAVAGSFYPATEEERWHGEAPWIVQAPSQRQSVLAAMLPHAGWGYCGKIVSELFSSIDLPKSILLIGPKHTREGVDWAVSPHRAWEIPESAPMEVDLSLTEQIATHVTGMQLDVAAHRREHGIEVLLPMLKRWSPSSCIAAMVLADASWSEIQRAAVELAEVIRLQPVRPLLVVSSDLNHYAADAENRRRDALALEAIQRGDPEQLLAVCREQRISMCGVIPAALVMETLRQLGCDARWHLQRYATSADAGGDPRRVIGYAGGFWLDGSSQPQAQEARSE